MANEAILMWETEIAIPIIVAEGTAIPKGTVLALSDNFVGSAGSADGDIFAGITKIEKIADDGNAKIAAYFGGWFKMVVGSGGVTYGQLVVQDTGVNLIKDSDADTDLADGLVIGKAYETGTAGETVLVHVGVLG